MIIGGPRPAGGHAGPDERPPEPRLHAFISYGIYIYIYIYTYDILLLYSICITTTLYNTLLQSHGFTPRLRTNGVDASGAAEKATRFQTPLVLTPSVPFRTPLDATTVMVVALSVRKKSSSSDWNLT